MCRRIHWRQLWNKYNRVYIWVDLVKFSIVYWDIDDCNIGICQNGGSCVVGVNSYTCSCLTGFLGDNCETSIIVYICESTLWKYIRFLWDVDDCTVGICQNGGSCVDGVNSYTCSCVAGFTGENCETSIVLGMFGSHQMTLSLSKVWTKELRCYQCQSPYVTMMWLGPR